MATSARNFRVEIHSDAQQQTTDENNNPQPLATAKPGQQVARHHHPMSKTVAPTTTSTSSPSTSSLPQPPSKRALGDITNAVRTAASSQQQHPSQQIASKAPAHKIRRTGTVGTKPPQAAIRRSKCSALAAVAVSSTQSSSTSNAATAIHHNNPSNNNRRKAISNTTCTTTTTTTTSTTMTNRNINNNNNINNNSSSNVTLSGSPMATSATVPRRAGLMVTRSTNSSSVVNNNVLGPSALSCEEDVECRLEFASNSNSVYKLEDGSSHVNDSKVNRIGIDDEGCGVGGGESSFNSLQLEQQEIIEVVDAPRTPYGKTVLPPGVVDIDAEDMGDCVTVSQFASHIHRQLVGKETSFMADALYMNKQHDVTSKMRCILVDWLVDVHSKFKLRQETLYLTINIIDRYLSMAQVGRRKLQLVGVTAMLIASKYEDIYAPEVNDFVYISDKAYTKKEIITMEANILNHLDFDITVPYALTFMNRCLKSVQVSFGKLSDVHVNLAHYVVELSLPSSQMLLYRPSVIGASAVLVAGKMVYGEKKFCWDDTMKFYSGDWGYEDLEQCCDELKDLVEHENDLKNTNKLTAVKRKFSSVKFGYISTAVIPLITTTSNSGDATNVNKNNGVVSDMDICAV